jgi:uncharacterized membrane protein
MADPPDDTPKSPIRSGIDVLLIIVILGALVAITIFVVNHYKGQSTDAATILGIVVPAFATIGAAAFGITVAYNAGAAKGEAKGDSKAQTAATEAKSATATSLLAYVEPALSAVSRVRNELETVSHSRPGENLLRFDIETNLVERGASTALNPQPLHEAEAQLERLRGAIESLTQN